MKSNILKKKFHFTKIVAVVIEHIVLKSVSDYEIIPFNSHDFFKPHQLSPYSKFNHLRKRLETQQL